MWPPGDCAVRQIRAFTRSRLSTNSAQLSLIIILSAAVSRCAAADDQVARASTRTAVVRPEVTSDFRQTKPAAAQMIIIASTPKASLLPQRQR